ncbi:MAG: CDP-alcohol phosphatidyltransferase family protein [Candidatus Omnitrophica bacterium]|nr:CDP-alcohol phosphatidyltransferase family protein [Candidatus Omnitrophota bacterium]
MNWPNRLTLTRLLIVPFIIIAIIYRREESVVLNYLPLVLFSIGSFLDALDGFIARTYHLKTELGTFLDPLADKTLILVTFISLHFSSSYAIKMPVWVLIIIAFRDAMIVMWLIVSYMNRLEIVIQPNFLGKTTTCFQMITIITLLLEFAWAPYMWRITFVLTVFSAASYIWRETRKLKELRT